MRKRNFIVLLAVLTGASLITTVARADHPLEADTALTPGAVCTAPSEYRYPEQIAYCERDVSAAKKKSVIKSYMEKYPNFEITPANRPEYKIDHFIPLCMGGANSRENLWPQHESIFTVTDRLEDHLCAEMALGTLRQYDAIYLIMFAKSHIEMMKAQPDPAGFLLHLEIPSP